MSSPNAAQRVYFRIAETLPAGTTGAVTLLGVPLKGVIRRVRFSRGAAKATNVDFALAESPMAAGAFAPSGGDIDLILRNTGAAAVAVPFELFADSLTDWEGAAAPGNEGIPFQLAPSGDGSTTGSISLSWTTSVSSSSLAIQITIEPLVP